MDWYVTDGQSTVGPVDMNLLLRGFSSGRVARDHLVWTAPWGDWRRVDSLREVREEPIASGSLRGAHAVAAYRAQLERAALRNEVDALVGGAADDTEAFSAALAVAGRIAQAPMGLVHRREPGHRFMRTTAALGFDAYDQLGHLLGPRDPALRAARLGAQLIERPYRVPAGESASRRLANWSTLLRGVALLPLFHGGRLIGLMELGRTDHAFRRSDLMKLRVVTSAVSRRPRRDI